MLGNSVLLLSLTLLLAVDPPGNQAPTAVSDTYSITVLPGVAYPLSPDVKQNDVDPDGDSLTVGLAATPLTTLGATVTISSGQMLYTMPAAAYAALGSGQQLDSFTYMVTDGKGGTAVGSVTVQCERRSPVHRQPGAAAGSTMPFAWMNRLQLHVVQPPKGCVCLQPCHWSAQPRCIYHHLMSR